jgi:hypothetical protein
VGEASGRLLKGLELVVRGREPLRGRVAIERRSGADEREDAPLRAVHRDVAEASLFPVLGDALRRLVIGG